MNNKCKQVCSSTGQTGQELHIIVNISVVFHLTFLNKKFTNKFYFGKGDVTYSAEQH